LALSQQLGNVCSFELLSIPGKGVSRLQWSDNARAMLALGPEAPLNSMDSLYDRLHPDDRAAALATSGPGLRDFVRASAEYRIVLPGGRVRWISQVVDIQENAPEGCTRLLGILKDVTESKRQLEQLERQAFHDALTGLGNRALLLDRLDAALDRAREDGSRLALLFIDLDDFKLVNDSMGHTFGDSLLQAFAERLAESRPSDASVYRLGSDEFALLMERVSDEKAALAAASKITASLDEPFRNQNYEFFISASIGVALNDALDASGLDLLRDADTAMYSAKSIKTKSFLLFESHMHDRAAERFQLIGDMHRALQRDEFFLAYQPIVRLAALDLVGYEALLRWRHPDRGLIMPGAFIPLAEESGLIARLGMRAMEMACAQAREWADARPKAPPFVSINVSVHQLRQADFVQSVDDAVRRHGLDPTQIKLEITESGVMEDVEFSLGVLRDLAALTVRLEIDDFGTGYSSLSYLRRIPAEILKVDRSFVTGIEHDGEKLAIVKTILGLARILGMAVVAEGVETAAQLSILRGLGCEYAQGYLFDKPLTPEEADALTGYAHLLPPGETT